MDQVLADTLAANLKAARTPEETQHALVLSMIALIDCQRKTAERVKAMVAERERFAWAGRLVWGFASGGGFVALAWILHRIGVMA